MSMKNNLKIVLLALFCLPIMAIAQNTDLEKFFDKYHGLDDVSSIKISMNAIQISMAEDEEDYIGDLLEQVDKVRILNFKNRFKTFRDSDFREEIAQAINKDYKLLIDVIDGKETVKIYIVNGEENQITEGLIMVQEDDEASLIWVTGNMKLSDFMHSHKHFRKYH